MTHETRSRARKARAALIRGLCDTTLDAIRAAERRSGDIASAFHKVHSPQFQIAKLAATELVLAANKAQAYASKIADEIHKADRSGEY